MHNAEKKFLHIRGVQGVEMFPETYELLQPLPEPQPIDKTERMMQIYHKKQIKNFLQRNPRSRLSLTRAGSMDIPIIPVKAMRDAVDLVVGQPGAERP